MGLASCAKGLRRSLSKLATAGGGEDAHTEKCVFVFVPRGAADWKILAERQSSDGTVKALGM